MIDREGRKRLALALRRFAIGRLTSDELDEVETDWRDRGARAVHQMSWCLHGSNGDTAKLPWTVRRELARWILFLRSGQEYLWPEHRFDTAAWPFFRSRRRIRIGTFETYWNKRLAQFVECGDAEVWPFINRAAFDDARRQLGSQA